MSRLTGNDARSLMEAYAAVYAPQITEEQVWEEVEEWVNSLVEEGYDLSEYSWEEMYEAYIEESYADLNTPEQRSRARINVNLSGQGRMNSELGRTDNRTRPASYRGPSLKDLSGQGRMNSELGRSSTNTNRSRVGNIPPQEGTGRGSPGSRIPQDPGRFARERERLRNVGNPSPSRNQPPAASSPAGARPAAAPAGARPAAGAPTGKPAPAASTPTRASSPANATTAQKIAGGTEVYNKQRAAGDFKAASETGKQVFSVAQSKLADAAAERERTRGTSATTNPLMKDFKSRLPAPAPAPSTTSSTSSPFTNTDAAKSAVTTATKPAPAPAPKPIPAATGSKKPGSIVSHYDPFDVVIGHLLDEGYADSEESALAIMANMSEEWKDGIMEMEYNKKRPLEARPLEARPLEARPTRSLQSNTKPKPDMSTPQDKIDAKRIKNTPLGARLTSPGGPIRNPGPATGPNGFLNRNK